MSMRSGGLRVVLLTWGLDLELFRVLAISTIAATALGVNEFVHRIGKRGRPIRSSADRGNRDGATVQRGHVY